MAKNFPYFKFIASEWMTGDIVFESLSVQGLFINICALYWQRNGSLSIDDINKRYKNPEELAQLTDRFFSVNDGLISVKFLDEQLIEANHISKVNSENGSKGGRPKAPKTLKEKPTANRPLTDRKANESKEEKETEENKNKNKEKNNDNFLSILLTSESWLELTSMNSASKFNPDQVKIFLKKYNDTINARQDFKNNKTEYCSHFVSWLDKQKVELGPTTKRRVIS
jgi:uncharacterized protein YdaU (DUF1376 family)